MNDLKFKGSLMSTSSYIKGNTSLAVKRVTFMCNDHSKLHEGNTPNLANSLSFNRWDA